MRIIPGLVKCLVGYFALLICVPSPAFARSENHQANAVPSAARDRPGGLIKLDVVVQDAGGAPVPALHREDFNLLEDGRQQKILSFEAFDGRGDGQEPAVKVLFVIDTLNLQASVANEERLSILRYLHQAGGRLERPVSIFMLANSGLWAMAPSKDGNLLARDLQHNNFKLVSHDIGSSDTSAEMQALAVLGQIATTERRNPGRKLLLWVGPGSGIGSGASPAAYTASASLAGAVWWFSALLREAHLALYSFSVGGTDSQAQLYKAYLSGITSPHEAGFMNLDRKVLAIQSGGRVIDGNSDLAQQIDKSVQDDGPFYRISFDPFPANRINDYHDLKVVVGKPGLVARTTTGYYDQPYYSVAPLPPRKALSVQQLQQLLAASHGQPDGKLAAQLSEIALTQRLSEQKLALLDETSGKRVRKALRILADLSSFQDPPADEIPTDASPDLETQRRLLALTSAYLHTTIRKLPDLYARRTTVRYEEKPMYLVEETSAGYQPLHDTDSYTTTVRYRNGLEVEETKSHKLRGNELVTYGSFGPVLEGVLDVIEKRGGLTWDRWEQGMHGRVAVFGYIVPSDRSLYQVALCCLPEGDGKETFERQAGYRVEIAIDPASGAILRLAFEADMKSTTPVDLSSIMVEYGPVEIGGKTYICPLRSVSFTRARAVRMLSEWNEGFLSYGPYTTMLNESTFNQYHVFRSESRLLPGFTSGTNQ
ncbi:MAG TPA: VWA domain-containing protein [Acidobacteriaceae bacterium]|nr:VWA domain-containing protein [Acidobacteriaceae bacterium]